MIIYFIIVSSTCLSAKTKGATSCGSSLFLRQTEGNPEPEGSSPRSACAAELTKNGGGADSLGQGMNSTTPDPHYDCKPNNPVRLISTHEQIQLISCMN